MLKYLTFANALVCYGTYVACAFILFRRVLTRDPGELLFLKACAVVSQTAILVGLWYSTVPGYLSIVANAVLLLSLGLFAWTARTNRASPLSLPFSPDSPAHLQERGPYRFVRHPFYLAYLLGYVGGVIGTGSALSVLPLLLMTAIYYRAAKREESKFDASRLRAGYAEYRRRTGMFLPGI